MYKKKAFVAAGALVLIVLGGLGGWAVASNQEYKPYPYLSDFYNAEYTPTFADWVSVNFNANNNCEGYLSEKLIQQNCRLFLFQDGLSLSIGTKTQPNWDVYIGQGRFSVSDRELRAAYVEAVDIILLNIRSLFPEEESGLSDQEIEIVFFIHGAEVGTWRGGVFKLAGEE